jgi:hypothetical protein
MFYTRFVLQQQATWVDRLLTQKSGIYFTMRIRIALRKKGLLPLDDSGAEEKLIAEWKSRESDFDVTPEDVKTALYEGQEVRLLILQANTSCEWKGFDDLGHRPLLVTTEFFFLYSRCKTHVLV